MKHLSIAVLCFGLTCLAHAVDPVAPETARPELADQGEYQMKDQVVEIDVSEYAGYSGLVVANGGLEPNADSYFSKTLGLKVRLSISESDSSSAINSGRFAAGATTVDVLAVYGQQFNVSVPLLLSYSRGADGIIVDSDISKINDLKGKAVAIQQNCEAEFFIRFLLRECDIPCKFLTNLGQTPDPASVNFICYEDPFKAGDAFADELRGSRRLAGCVTWAPKTTELVQASNGKAKQLVDNQNFLLIADILVVNKAFAQKSPKVVEALVHGALWGNQQVRTQPAQHLPTIAKAFKWTPEKARLELDKVHLANLPENTAFFADDLDLGGSFPNIFLVAQGCYEFNSTDDSSVFLDPRPLAALRANSLFSGEKISITPRRRAGVAVETPILNKQVHFSFKPEQAVLDDSTGFNTEQFKRIDQLLQFSISSTILLTGHVDPSQKDKILQQGGPELVRESAVSAMVLSMKRAKAIQEILVTRFKLDPSRIRTKGEGWNRPISTKPTENMRVELNLLTIE